MEGHSRPDEQAVAAPHAWEMECEGEGGSWAQLDNLEAF